MSLYDAPGRDYTSSPDDLEGDNQPRGPLCSCCSTVIDGGADRTYSVSGVAQIHNRASRLAGTVARQGPRWRGQIKIDQPQRIIEVTLRLGAKNSTGATSRYPTTEAVSNEQFARELGTIKGTIERAWNKPYTVVIVDDKCGEQRFQIRYVADLRVVTSTWGHYTIDFINVRNTRRDIFDPNGIASWRSWVAQGAWTAKWNLGGPRSASSLATGRSPVMEPHEFGHMIGLWDEYEEFRDLNADGDGNDRVNGVWEADRGGVNYRYPNGASETHAANGELMASMRQRRARPARYSISVLFAVKEILERQGRSIRNIYTIGQPSS